MSTLLEEKKELIEIIEKARLAKPYANVATIASDVAEELLKKKREWETAIRSHDRKVMEEIIGEEIIDIPITPKETLVRRLAEAKYKNELKAEQRIALQEKMGGGEK